MKRFTFHLFIFCLLANTSFASHIPAGLLSLHSPEMVAGENSGINTLPTGTLDENEPTLLEKSPHLEKSAAQQPRLHSPVLKSAAVSTWELQLSVPCAQAVGEAGIETDGDYIYVTRWNDNLFYRYTMDGTFVEAFTVAGASNVRDLAYDGCYFYGSNANTTLFKMDFTPGSETLAGIINAPVSIRAIAYNDDLDAFYANNWSSAITLFDRNGTILSSGSLGSYGSLYGLAYDNVSDGGPYLWGFSQSGSGALIIQYNALTYVETGFTFDVDADLTISDGLAGGLFTSDLVVSGTFSIGGMVQNEKIFAYKLTDLIRETYVRDTDEGVCTYTVDGSEFDPASFLDDCTGDILVNDYNGGSTLAGAVFNKGTTQVTWTLTDASNPGGDIDTCSFTVTVNDNEPPVVVANPLDVFLREDGEYVLNQWDIEEIVEGTEDNCTPYDDLEISVFPRTFQCIHVSEPVEVKVTAIDAAGNSYSEWTTVTVHDTIPPVMNCQDIEVALDENGKARIYPALINVGTSHTSIPEWARTYNDMESGCYDACGIELLELSRYEFTCEDIGPNTVTMTATDPSGNSSECEVTVTVVDGAMPWVECTDTSLVLDESGMAQLTMEMVVSDYGDICGVDTVIIEPMDFGCEMTGDNEVTVTVIDNGGNQAVCTAMVTVHDNQVPVIEQQEDIEITVVPGICMTPVEEYPEIVVTDNCDIELTLEGYGPSGMFPLGTSLETWTATDNGGNTAAMSFNITISTYNGAPAIDAVDDIIMVKDSGAMVLTLTGITPGMDCEEQSVIEVTALSSDTTIVKTTIEYETGADTASLNLNPADFGQAEITVTVMDDGGTENGGTDVTEITFKVDVVEEMPVYSDFDLADMKVKLYPNPTSDMVYIDINRNVLSPVDLSVYTISGKQIIRRVFNDSQYISFSMKDHVSGMYFVKMNIDGQRVVKKLVLDRQ